MATEKTEENGKKEKNRKRHRSSDLFCEIPIFDFVKLGILVSVCFGTRLGASKIQGKVGSSSPFLPRLLSQLTAGSSDVPDRPLSGKCKVLIFLRV